MTYRCDIWQYMAPIPFGDSPSPSITALCLGPRKGVQQSQHAGKILKLLEFSSGICLLSAIINSFGRCLKLCPSNNSINAMFKPFCIPLLVLMPGSDVHDIIDRESPTNIGHFLLTIWRPNGKSYLLQVGPTWGNSGEMLDMLRWRYEMLKFSPLNQTAQLLL